MADAALQWLFAIPFAKGAEDGSEAERLARTLRVVQRRGLKA
jgi:hypothetical protein